MEGGQIKKQTTPAKEKKMDIQKFSKDLRDSIIAIEKTVEETCTSAVRVADLFLEDIEVFEIEIEGYRHDIFRIDGVFVDVTCEQFGYSPFVGSLPGAYKILSEKEVPSSSGIADEKAIVSEMIKKGWEMII